MSLTKRASIITKNNTIPLEMCFIYLSLFDTHSTHKKDIGSFIYLDKDLTKPCSVFLH